MASASADASASAVAGDDGSVGGGQGGIDRDVNSILANLNQEQLASIVAAARASENGQGGDDAFGSSAPDTSSILAALPPGPFGQAASALTALTSSVKKDGNDVSTAEAVADMAEAAAEDQQAAEAKEDANGEEQHQAYTEGEAEGDAQAQTVAERYGEEGQVEHADGEAKGDETGNSTKLEDESMQPGNETTDDYRNENATQAAIAAMESLAAQSSLDLYGGQDDTGRSGSQARRRDAGPEAERMRKDQHKEVERKRREQISNGITELQAIVPGCDTKGINKTAIINAAVRYIQELKNNEASNIEKWTLEKLLMDQAMNDLQQQLEHVRKENSQFREQLGLPEPEEEPIAEHYGGEGELADGQQGLQDDAAMADDGQAIATDDANLDPNLGKDGPADAIAETAEEATGEEAIANGVTAAADDDPITAPATDKSAAGLTRTADAADIAESDAGTTRAKRSRHA